MSTEAKEVKINRSAVNALTAAIADGLHKVGGTGSLLHSCVTIARQHYKGKAIPKHDVNAVLAELVVKQGWKGRTIDIRKSEYRAVLDNYAKLPEAMKAFSAKAGRCSWHDGIALARLLRTKAPSVAAAQHANRKPAKSVKPQSLARADAKAAIAAFVKRVLKMTKVESDFRESLAELCGKYNIKL